ncbi:phosphate ABC transporter substrate-binding protein [Pseudoduganella sp. GCM10020061]|uniref:phosphate ABC transporter substrate-binding protein n=1 Tax=Pseudoduganella sp. GCM10020061 TaxID=3317345 RepID=UPI0036257584
MRKLIRLFCTALLALQCSAAAAEVIVVVSAHSPLASLRAEQVADIFLGRSGRFPDGSRAIPLDQALGSPLRHEFYLRAAAMSPPLVKAHWTKMIFTGRGRPPKEVQNSAAVRKLVAENPAYVGYIDRAALDASVKPVLLLN